MSRTARPVVAALGALLLALAGAACGSNQEANKLRAPNPIETTVKIDNSGVVVSPDRFGFTTNGGLSQPASAPEVQAEAEGKPVKVTTQKSPESGQPQPLQLTIINLSDKAATLSIRGPVSITSDLIAAGQTGNLKVNLVTGSYVVVAQGIKGAKPAKIAVGPHHPSAQNNLLLP